MRVLAPLCMAAMLSCVCGAAMAQPDPLDALYSGTIVESRADGSGGKLMFNRDGSVMIMMGPRPMMGTFTRNEKNEFCLQRPVPPPGAPAPVGGPPPGQPLPCVALPTTVGQKVDRTGPNGRVDHFELVAGREAPPPPPAR